MLRQSAQLPLHDGKAPACLFNKMVRLAGAIVMAIVDSFGAEEMLRRLSDPWWFQAFGCVLGFDWHSSGVTTVTCGALKEASQVYGCDLGIFVTGGKGATGRKTPEEISKIAERVDLKMADRLIYASRMAAKVDSSCVQDGFDLYHHSFIFTKSGSWSVVQQGMNPAVQMARRYHWWSGSISSFVCEPHAAVADSGLKNLSDFGSSANPDVINMTALEGEKSRQACVFLVNNEFESIDKVVRSMGPDLFAPSQHMILPSYVNVERLKKIVKTAHLNNPKDFEALVGTKNVGLSTIRSLALIAELIYNVKAPRRDPALPPPAHGSNITTDQLHLRSWADYAFAHGGKDGIPFPVNKKLYEQNIRILLESVQKARIGILDKERALRRLAAITDKIS